MTQKEHIGKRTEQLHFAVYCTKWLKVNQSRLKKSTLVKYHVMLEKHIKPYFGNRFMEELTSDQMAEFSKELLQKKHLSEKTVRDILIFLHEIIVYIQQDTGQTFPLVISYPRLERRELRVLSMEEQQAFMQFLLQNMDIYKFSVLLALLTGLRVGEVCALQWKHILLESRILTVKQTIQRIKNPDIHAETKTILLLGTPKTGSSIRTIPLMDGLIPLFQIFHQDNPEAFLLTGNKRLADPRKLQRKLKNYTTALGLTDVHFHTLRHTFATRCIEAGCDTKTLSELLGHSNISTTMNRYVHPSLEWKRNNIMKLEQLGCFPLVNASPEKQTE